MSAPRVRLWAVAFWLFLWHLASIALDSRLLLVSPVEVLQRLLELVKTRSFWSSIAFSLSHIALGFFLACIAGSLLAALAARFRHIRELLLPIILTIKSVPVASFVVLALIWLSSKRLSVFISFLIVFPVIYTNLLEGICQLNRELAEMAQVFQVPFSRRLGYLYLPQLLPFFRSACQVSLGLCWKSGIAAEVIGIPEGSVGAKLQQAKIYLDTPDLFAWTFTIVLLSLICEKLFLKLLDAKPFQFFH